MTEEREERLEELSDRLGIGPKSKVLDEAMRLALKFLDLQAEKEEDVKEIQKRWELEG